MNRKQRRAAGKGAANNQGSGPDAGAAPGIAEWLAAALAHHQQGRLAEAETLYRQILAADPRHSDSLHLLGVIATQVGRHDAAIELIGRAILLNNRAPAFHNNLGNALRACGRPAEAIDPYRRALSLQPDYAEAHDNLGNALSDLGRHAAAVESYERALALRPDYAEAHGNLSHALQALGRSESAVAHAERAVALKPDLAEAHCNLGNALQALGRTDAALQCYRRALELKPAMSEAGSNLGTALHELGRLDEAVACYESVLGLRPDYAEALCNLASARQAQGRYDEAIACYERALSLRPDDIGACINHGSLLQDCGRCSEAALLFERAFARRPDRLGLLASARLCLPAISESTAQIADFRQRLSEGLRELAAAPGAIDDPVRAFCRRFFYLAYHGANDRALMAAACRMFRRACPALNYVAPGAALARQGGGRIRVGFLSRFFHDHTIGKLTQGFIRQLDRRRFHVVVIHAPEGRIDAMRQAIDGMADDSVVLRGDLAAAQAAVAALGLDVLHYPDIGMSSFSYFLAYARLAPVQTVGWGHPVTTGLDSIDYFLTFDAAEPADCAAHYSEIPVRFRRPPAYYEPFALPAEIPARAAFGLPAEGALYACPQSLFKFHPDFDGVLAAIAALDPSGWIVALDGANPGWKEALRQRWARCHPVLLERVVFLPFQPLDRFMMLLTLSDVMLDPVHFGGGNTLYESLACGIPSVTWPGRFMRGRLAAGLYRLLDIADAPVAATIADYAGLAVAIAGDRQRRETLRGELLRKGSSLYRDEAAVGEFAAFLAAAVDAAAAGRKLTDWRPPDEAGLPLHDAQHTTAGGP